MCCSQIFAMFLQLVEKWSDAIRDGISGEWGWGVLVNNIRWARVDQGGMGSFKWKDPTLLSRSLSNSSSAKIYSNTDIKCYLCRTARVSAKCNATCWPACFKIYFWVHKCCRNGYMKTCNS